MPLRYHCSPAVFNRDTLCTLACTIGAPILDTMASLVGDGVSVWQQAEVVLFGVSAVASEVLPRTRTVETSLGLDVDTDATLTGVFSFIFSLVSPCTLGS